MNEKHPDRTDEWAKQQNALKNPKFIAVPQSLKHPRPAVPSTVTEEKKDNQ